MNKNTEVIKELKETCSVSHILGAKPNHYFCSEKWIPVLLFFAIPNGPSQSTGSLANPCGPYSPLGTQEVV